ncbi:MAG: AIR synthase-related protein [Candidatus Hecatellaceae archaeon]
MSDLEGLANLLLEKGIPEREILERLTLEIQTFKPVRKAKAEKLARAVLAEVSRSRIKPSSPLFKKLLEPSKSGVTMGLMGVGCRGEGDFYVHSLIAKVSSLKNLKPLLGPLALDDAGAVEHGGTVVVVAVDGTHSRLSRFPLVAGFHVARAALRDVYVKGAKPLALFDDLHLSDDGDVGMLFDFVAGVSAVSELTGVPLVAGSTLRVGGDMVIGDRMVSCVGAVGIVSNLKALAAKRNVKPGDLILMTEGAGGGTIATTAIYAGKPEILKETLNVRFLETCDFLLGSGLAELTHSMTDITNGGIRGDAPSICKEAKVGIVVDEESFRGLVNPKVLSLLEEYGVDPLGVSIDSLLMFTPESYADTILKEVRRLGVKVDIVGEVLAKPRKALLHSHGRTFELKPKFRESAYTEVKKLVGEKAEASVEELKVKVAKAYREALAKRRLLVKIVRKARGTST